MGGHGKAISQDGVDEEKHPGYLWLAFCVIGLVSSLTLYGICMEYVTSGGRKLHEFSFLFVTTAIYATTAYVFRGVFKEKPTTISKYQMLILSLTSIASTFTSVRSLRYVIYPVQILFKSCKPVPVMAFGVALGKKYPLQKYVNVIIITTGVALFMSGGSSASKHGTNITDSTFLGAAMLSASLCFDGATGAYEDRLMAKDDVAPFDLMFNIQLGKAVISFVCLVTTNGVPAFVHTIQHGGIMLLLLGLSGAMGQVFIFLTISKFGALNCALIGLGRKLLSLLLSFILYGHSVNGIQSVGLALSLAAMIANFVDKGAKKKNDNPPENSTPETEALLSNTAEAGGEGDGKEEYDIEKIVPNASTPPRDESSLIEFTDITPAATPNNADSYTDLPSPDLDEK